ncbi:unnamed protein product [Durusdinium trenchii]
MAEHPLVLDSEGARPLMDVAFQRLKVAHLENPSAAEADHLAAACLCLALAAKSRKKAPVRRLPETGAPPEEAALQRLLTLALEAQATIPPSLSMAEYLTKPLLAAALLPSSVDMSAGVAAILEEETFWRGAKRGAASRGPSVQIFGGFPSKPVARAVGALGMMQEQGVELPTNTSQRVLRLLDLERFENTELPELVLLYQGLRGLGLESRIKEARELQQERLKQRGAAAVPALELCEALLVLKTCGRLTPEQPFVFDFVRLAANNVDRLKRGERRVLRTLLEHLAQHLGFEPGVSWVDLAQAPAPQHAPGSPEASICMLARHDWFSRKSRAHTSWFRQRGHLR